MKINGLETREMRDLKTGEQVLAVRFYADKARPPFPPFLERSVDGREARFRLNGAVIVADGDWIVQRSDGTVYLRTPQTFDAVGCDHPDNAGTDDLASTHPRFKSTMPKEGKAEKCAELILGRDSGGVISQTRLNLTLGSDGAWLHVQYGDKSSGYNLAERSMVDAIKFFCDALSACLIERPDVMAWLDGYKEWREWAAGRMQTDVGKFTDGEARETLDAHREQGLAQRAALERWREWAMTVLKMDQSKTMVVDDVDDHLIKELYRRASIKLLDAQPEAPRSARLFVRARDRDFLLFVGGKGFHSCCTGAKRMPYRRALENRVLSDFLVDGKCPTGWNELSCGTASAEARKLKEQKG